MMNIVVVSSFQPFIAFIQSFPCEAGAKPIIFHLGHLSQAGIHTIPNLQ